MVDLERASALSTALDIEFHSYQFVSQISIHCEETKRTNLGKLNTSALWLLMEKKISRHAARLTLRVN
jgi:hypothetical protein